MKRLVFPTKRPYDGQLFGVLYGLNVVAAFALIPFAMHMQGVYGAPGSETPPGWGAMAVDRIVTLLLIAPLAALGLKLAHRIGLGLPFLESWVKKVSPPRRFRGILALGVLVGVGCAGLILALDLGFFTPRMLRMFQELGIATPKDPTAPPLYGLLAAFSAGVTEETLFRLFGLSLLAWLGGLLFRDAEGRPRLAVFWTANILFALVFGAAHLAGAHSLGWPMNALVLTRIFLLNGLGGLAFGWLFWTYGLESAMLAHFFTDVGLYTLLPIIIRQEGQGAKTLAGVVVGIVLLAGMIWAARTIILESSSELRRGPLPIRTGGADPADPVAGQSSNEAETSSANRSSSSGATSRR